jgi:predicted DNA-binding ribbon-helix-helix protein
MSLFSLRLPKTLHEDLKALAEEEGVSVNQFISQALAEKIAVLKQADRIAYYRSHPKVSRKDFLTVLDKAGKRKPVKGDEVL